MGLAASQARFLAITSRKMNCESQSLQISQQKLSITRDLQKASTEYQQALDATKLVFDCGTADNDVYDLSYAALMTPSAINEYEPYLITDTKGKIVLSEAMWKASIAAGIIDENGDPTGNGLFTMGSADSVDDGSRNAFLYQLGVQNIAAPSTINSIIKLGEIGYNDAGVGGDILDKTLAGNYNSPAFINYLKTEKDDDGNYLFGLISQKKEDDENGNTKTVKIPDIPLSSITSWSKNTLKSMENNKCLLTSGGDSKNILSESAIEDLTLGDILEGKYTLSMYSKDTDGEKKAQQVASDILKQMAELLGYGSTDNIGLAVTDQARDALGTAYEMTMAMLFGSVDTYRKQNKDNWEYKNASSFMDRAINEAQSQNDMVKVPGTNGRYGYAVSITNLLKSFLTNFALAMEGFDCGLNVDKDSVKKSNYVTDNQNYYFQLKNEDQPAHDVMNADFYNMLYNQICQNGACNDEMKRQQVTDNDYIKHGLKNGQLFLSTLNTDGHFYQGPYTASGHVTEVKDEDAIARAEAEYNVTKSKLNYKEETLDLQMKNLDTEISALSTEFDTVKSLISKGIEKVFTMFSS